MTDRRNSRVLRLLGWEIPDLPERSAARKPAQSILSDSKASRDNV